MNVIVWVLVGSNSKPRRVIYCPVLLEGKKKEKAVGCRKKMRSKARPTPARTRANRTTTGVYREDITSIW